MSRLARMICCWIILIASQPNSLLILMVWVPVIHCCACPILHGHWTYNVIGHWTWIYSALESGQEARIVQIDFSASFDRVAALRVLEVLCCLY